MPFSIKDIANLTGIKAHTIRIWEQRYSLLKPERTDTNIRYYSNKELQMVLNIALLNKYGYKISHINSMTEQVMAEKILSLPDCNAKLEKIVNDLIKKMIDLDIIEFENILDNYIAANGIEKAMLQIIFPFLTRIGILWVTYNINAAQEHIVSNIIRQKVLVGIENLKPVKEPNKKICLFLPEGEYHELGLLFISFLIKKNGNAVIYLGASMPLKDVEYVVRLKDPDYLFIHITTTMQSANFQKLINKLSDHFKDTITVISGPPVAAYKKRIPPKFKFKKSLLEVLDFIGDL